MFPVVGVPVVTLTATENIREAIISEMSMAGCEFVVLDCNKINIKYCILTANDIEVNFTWLVIELKYKRISTTRVIVFCQSRK